MGAEVGATTSLFPFDGRMATYLRATGRDRIVDLAESVEADLRADEVVTDEPLKYYDRVIEIDLSELEPYINGPFAGCGYSYFRVCGKSIVERLSS